MGACCTELNKNGGWVYCTYNTVRTIRGVSNVALLGRRAYYAKLIMLHATNPFFATPWRRVLGLREKKPFSRVSKRITKHGGSEYRKCRPPSPTPPPPLLNSLRHMRPSDSQTRAGARPPRLLRHPRRRLLAHQQLRSLPQARWWILAY